MARFWLQTCPTRGTDGVQGATFFFTEPESSDGVTYQFLDAASFHS